MINKRKGAKAQRHKEGRLKLFLSPAFFAPLCLCAFAFSQNSQVPTELTQVRFNYGQNIVPYFEGWIRNPDGTFDLVFGYFNRNWKEELAIPAGTDNRVEPNGPDAGQPTWFLPRRQRWIYRLRVPADFGKKEATWTITTNGKTETAYGNLLAAQEISERIIRTNGNLDPGEGDTNEPPSITLPPALTGTTSTPLRITVSVRDDGLPKPRAPRTPKPATPGGFGGQVDRGGPAPARGLTTTWLQIGGPGKAIFEQTGAAVDVRFSVRGAYRLRAVATDGAQSTTADTVVTVK